MTKKDYTIEDSAKSVARSLIKTRGEGVNDADDLQTQLEQLRNENAKLKSLVKESKTERLQLLLAPSLKEWIQATASKKDMSMNNFINALIEEYKQAYENN